DYHQRLEPPCYYDAYRGGQISTEGPPVGEDPDAVSEMLHVTLLRLAWRKRTFMQRRRIRMRRREVYRSELLCGGKARQLRVCQLPDQERSHQCPLPADQARTCRRDDVGLPSEEE